MVHFLAVIRSGIPDHAAAINIRPLSDKKRFQDEKQGLHLKAF